MELGLDKQIDWIPLAKSLGINSRFACAQWAQSHTAVRTLEQQRGDSLWGGDVDARRTARTNRGHGGSVIGECDNLDQQLYGHKST